MDHGFGLLTYVSFGKKHIPNVSQTCGFSTIMFCVCGYLDAQFPQQTKLGQYDLTRALTKQQFGSPWLVLSESNKLLPLSLWASWMPADNHTCSRSMWMTSCFETSLNNSLTLVYHFETILNPFLKPCSAVRKEFPAIRKTCWNFVFINLKPFLTIANHSYTFP